MTPQSNFMVLAPIDPEREGATCARLLDSMNDAPGRVNANNALIPFAQFDTLHFARLLILDDQTTGDVRAHGLPSPAPTRSTSLSSATSMATEDAFLDELASRARERLARSSSPAAKAFAPDTDLVDVDESAPQLRPIANYVNCRGRTVRQVREEAALARGARKPPHGPTTPTLRGAAAAGAARRGCGPSCIGEKARRAPHALAARARRRSAGSIRNLAAPRRPAAAPPARAAAAARSLAPFYLHRVSASLEKSDPEALRRRRIRRTPSTLRAPRITTSPTNSARWAAQARAWCGC